MLLSFLSRFEDIDNALLGPTLWGLERWGMLKSPKRNAKMYMLLHICATIFVITQYIELWRIRSDLQLALRNLSVTMLSTVCVVKAWTFVAWQPFWKDIIEYISSLEKKQLSLKNKETNHIITDYTSYSRKVTYFYWCLVMTTVLAVLLSPLAGYLTSGHYRELMRNGSKPYPEIMSSYIPFDRTRGFWYWITVIEHTIICIYGGGIVATYDSNAMVMMSFFGGQFKILSNNCSRIFDTESRRDIQWKIQNRIKECHDHHVALIRYSKVLNGLLSPVMFLYVIICSLMICASAVQLNMDGITTFQRIWILEYLIALIAQLFIYCWHSNDVFFMSKSVDEGVAKCNWTSASAGDRKSILLLQGQLRKTITFTAGPFTTLTVATFVSILKVSYNYYTLLSNKD